MYFSTQLKPSMFGKSDPQEPEAAGDIISTVKRQGAKNVWAQFTFFFLHSAGSTLRKRRPHFRARLPISITLISMSFWCAWRQACVQMLSSSVGRPSSQTLGFLWDLVPNAESVALVIYSNVKYKRTQMLVLQ